MSDVINGVPRELLEHSAQMVQFYVEYLCATNSEESDIEMAGVCVDALRALLTAQPQASAAQSAPAGAVVMPPQCTDKAQHVKYRNGWNSCLSEVVRLNRAQSMPEDWKLVPVKPSIEMVEAGYEASLGQPDRSGHARAIEMFDAMLAAAPAQPAAHDQGEVQRPPSGWRVFFTTSSVVREGDRWEVYGPNGGGAVSAHDVKDWAVRKLLDALAASTGQEVKP